MLIKTRLASFLFVCTGNICRSPLAEAAMRAEALKRGLDDADIDSAGIGSWHVGDPPDPRARQTGKRHGLDLDTQRARQIRPEDFTRFTHILALDASHLSSLKRFAPANSTARMSLLLDHAPGYAGHSVEDPYYGPDSGFETTYDEVTLACRHLADKLWGPAR